MKLPIHTAKAIINKCSTPQEAMDAIQFCEDIARAIGEYSSQLSALKKKHLEEVDALYARWDDVIAACPHLVTTFNGDPSGGSDTSIECDICRKTLTKADLAKRAERKRVT